MGIRLVGGPVGDPRRLLRDTNMLPHQGLEHAQC